MEINTALILCAGYGKRLNPITLSKPKPLIEINNTTLLKNTLNLVISLGVKNILINSFYLREKIEEYVANLNLNLNIISDGNKILDTGGGILNLINNSKKNDFLVFNPDTLWNLNYKKIIEEMENFYFENKIQNLLMVVNKKRSFDKRFKGDFKLKINKLSKEEDNNYIFTGCQMINKELFSNFDTIPFSITKIWEKQISENTLYGYESLNEFIHITDLEIYEKLIKNY